MIGTILSLDWLSEKKHSTYCMGRLEKNEPHKKRPQSNREKLIFLHTHVLISKYLQSSLCFETLLRFTWGCAHCQTALASFLLLLIIAQIPSIQTLWSVLETLCNYVGFLCSKLPHLFHHYAFPAGKRNPRYKTSVGNGQCGYWRTNDTTSHFRMKAEYRWQHLSASTMKGQQVTSQKVE